MANTASLARRRAIGASDHIAHRTSQTMPTNISYAKRFDTVLPRLMELADSASEDPLVATATPILHEGLPRLLPRGRSLFVAQQQRRMERVDARVGHGAEESLPW